MVMCKGPICFLNGFTHLIEKFGIQISHRSPLLFSRLPLILTYSCILDYLFKCITNGEEAKFHVKEEVITDPRIFRIGEYPLEKENPRRKRLGL
jgi:hypothetical protein